MIDRGTGDARSGVADIAEELDSRGITLTITVTRHLFSLVCTCLAEDFEPVLALLGDIVMAPSLPDDELATRKGEVITAIRQDEDNPAVRAIEALMALLYPDGHPYGRRTKGTIDVVERLTRDRLLRAARASASRRRELTAVVVGDVEPARAASVGDARVRRLASAVAGRRSRLPPVVPAAARRRLVIPMMNKAQADIAYGFTTITRARSGVLRVLADEQRVRPVRDRRPARRQHPRAAGDGVLRVELARCERLPKGRWSIRAGVSPANVDRAIASIDEEVGAARSRRR